MRPVKYNLPKGYLSYSGMALFLQCPRRFGYKYFDKVDREEGDERALDRGSLFHELAEFEGKVSDERVVEICEDPFEIVRVAEAYKTYRSAETRGIFPKMIHKEVHLVDEERQFDGYSDMIGVKKDGQWYLGELKTSARFDPTRWSTMSINMQTALYSAMSEAFAHEQFLLKEDFQGVSFRTVIFSGKKPLKQNTRRKTDETPTEYRERIKDDAQVHHQIIKPADYQEHEALQTFEYVKERIHACGGDSKRAPRNTQNCFMFNRPCEYFKHCHGISPNLEDVDAGVESGIDYEQ